MTLLYYESLFSGLNLHTAQGLASPHKVAMLLAVTDLIEDGALAENRIEYSDYLISAFAERFNYQAQLRDTVLAHLAGRKRDLEHISTVHDVDPPPYTANWDRVLDQDLPDHIPIAIPPKRKFLARHVNYSQREAENRLLGASGEQFVVDFERHCLTRAGREDLAREVEWSSREQGDGLGFDVRSFRIGDDGAAKDEEMYIEVKTTNRGKYQPFYISENEVEFSREFKDHYSLYRVYDFRSRGRRLFRMPGRIDDHVRLNPVLYRAGFG